MANEETNNNIAQTHDSDDDPEVVEVESTESKRKIISSHHRVSYSGPLPPAAEMERYAQIDPKMVDRIVAMAEKEAQHRHEMDEKILEHEAGDMKRGQHYALTIGLAGLFTSCFAIYFDAYWLGGILGGGTLAILVTAFIKGR